ncbi:MAG: hypothetical protein ACKOA5_12310 [Actinomycetota bacterium]
MADDDERLTTAPAPLPRHERAWRHPSEIGQQRRANARRPASPLGPFVTLLLGVLGLGVIAGLVALVMPREAPREVLPVVRNAAIATPSTPSSDASPGSAFPTIGGKRLVLAVGNDVFVTTGDGDATIANVTGRSVPLRVVEFDEKLGISVLRTDERVDVQAGFETSSMTPSVGSRVTVGSNETLDASVGVSVIFDAATFVPLAGDVLAVDVPEASPVKDAQGRLVGVYTSRNGAKGFVPIAAVNELLSRLR